MYAEKPPVSEFFNTNSIDALVDDNFFYYPEASVTRADRRNRRKRWLQAMFNDTSDRCYSLNDRENEPGQVAPQTPLAFAGAFDLALVHL